jgi:chromosomal replication initiation ATPase DnaA
LKSRSTKRDHAYARGVYAYFCRKMLYDTFQRIGDDINRDHSNVIYILKRIEGLICIKDAIADQIAAMEQKLLTTHI